MGGSRKETNCDLYIYIYIYVKESLPTPTCIPGGAWMVCRPMPGGGAKPEPEALEAEELDLSRTCLTPGGAAIKPEPEPFEAVEPDLPRACCIGYYFDLELYITF